MPKLKYHFIPETLHDYPVYVILLKKYIEYLNL